MIVIEHPLIIHNRECHVRIVADRLDRVIQVSAQRSSLHPNSHSEKTKPLQTLYLKHYVLGNTRGYCSCRSSRGNRIVTTGVRRVVIVHASCRIIEPSNATIEVTRRRRNDLWYLADALSKAKGKLPKLILSDNSAAYKITIVSTVAFDAVLVLTLQYIQVLHTHSYCSNWMILSSNKENAISRKDFCTSVTLGQDLRVSQKCSRGIGAVQSELTNSSTEDYSQCVAFLLAYHCWVYVRTPLLYRVHPYVDIDGIYRGLQGRAGEYQSPLKIGGIFPASFQLCDASVTYHQRRPQLLMLPVGPLVYST